MSHLVTGRQSEQFRQLLGCLYLLGITLNVYLFGRLVGERDLWIFCLALALTLNSMAAEAYRLLRAILMTAVDDELIDRNPLEQVYARADEMPARLRVLVLVTTSQACGSVR